MAVPDRRRSGRPSPVLTAVVLAVGLLAACGGAAARPSRQTTTTTSATTTTTTTTTTVPVTTTTTAAPADSDCQTGGLSITPSGINSALGHADVVVQFKNTGAGTCNLTGYPVVAELNPKGTQVALAVRAPSGYMGGLTGGATVPSMVSLAPGQSGSAIVEGEDTQADGAACPAYSALLITPPNNTLPVRVVLAAAFPDCPGIEVHPVVPGTTGSGP